MKDGEALLVFCCPGCKKPSTLEIGSADFHVSEEGQVYLYLGCARCFSEKGKLRADLGQVFDDPYLSKGN